VARRSRADSDHNPREEITKDFLPDDMDERPRHRFAAWFYEVNYNHAVARSYYTRRNFDNPREGGGIANRPNGFWCMPAIRPKGLGSGKRTCQGLSLLRRTHLLIVEGLRVKRAVEVVTCVRVPTVIAARHHNEKFALWGSPDPQRQPQIGPFPNCYGVPVFARNNSQLH
jgi:hypothetical protein